MPLDDGSLGGGSEAAVWRALLPALLLGSYFVIGFLLYTARLAFRGGFHDAEVQSRGQSWLIGMGPRQAFAWVMQPLWSVLLRLKIPADAITTLSVLLATAAGVALAAGRFSLGGWLYLFAGACDFIDGRIARLSGRTSKAGAALDSVLDRYSESVVLAGMAWFYRDSWVLVIALTALIGSNLVPYVRARGEGLGVDVRLGLMQRPERLVVIGLTAALSPVVDTILAPGEPQAMGRLAVVGLAMVAVATQVTALRRLAFVMRALDPDSLATWRAPAGRGGILRFVIVAAIATGMDAGLVALLVHNAVTPWLATSIGCLLGGAVSFSLNRAWTFGSTAPPIGQAGRYVVVSTTSALLNGGGVAVLLLLPSVGTLAAWILTRAAVFVTWNYPLHREYVYADAPRAPQA